jgi:hypothetical protein
LQFQKFSVIAGGVIAMSEGDVGRAAASSLLLLLLLLLLLAPRLLHVTSS